MKVHNVVQGSREWLQLRVSVDGTASEAPAVMGASKYQTREGLLKQKSTGITPDVDENQQRRFDAGHETEALFRPVAEDIIDDELYPCTGTIEVDGMVLLASFDGLTSDRTIGYEHKLSNQKLAADIKANGEPGPTYYWQMEHQLLVSGAEKILFATSDGTLEGATYCWYTSKLERRAALIAGWKQFKADLATYKPTAATPAVVAAPTESLPAVSVLMSGELAVQSNLPEFSTALRAFIEKIPAKPETDQEFADTEAACKALKKAEDALEDAENSALAQMSSVEEMRRVVGDLRTLARTTRLAKEKLVSAQKDAIRERIVTDARKALVAHIAGLNESLGKPYMPDVPADFGAAIKGKRTIDSLKEATGVELARAKAAANEIATRIQVNLNFMRDRAAKHAFLFADTATLVLKAADDLQAVVTSRIAEHDRQEAERLEKERARIRAEEEDRIRREAEARARAEQAAALAAVTPAPAPVIAAPAPVVTPAAPVVTAPAPDVSPVTAMATAPAANNTVVPITRTASNKKLRLGEICEALGFAVTADFLGRLGFQPAETERAAKLYWADDLPRICQALISHLTAIGQRAAA